MNIGGIIGGTIAAVIGAVVWAAIAFYGNIEIGYLAWGIGLLVGLGVSAGSQSGGVGAALIAVILTIVSLLGGKYAATHMIVSESIDKETSGFVMTDEGLAMRLANEQVSEAMSAGKQVKFRNGKNYESTESLADFPVAIAQAAKKQLEAMSEEERTAKKAEAEHDYNEVVAAFKSQFVQQAFMDSFGPIDIIFFLLGIFTAGKVALSDVIDS